MLPVQKPIREYRTLEEIRQRKDELLNDLQQDNTLFSKLWNQVFLKREDNTKTDFIAGLVSNGIVAVDTFLLIRKLLKGYGFLFGFGSKKKKKRKRFEGGSRIQDYSELSVGDFVVHESHGLGIYRGIEQVTVDHVTKDLAKTILSSHLLPFTVEETSPENRSH